METDAGARSTLLFMAGVKPGGMRRLLSALLVAFLVVGSTAVVAGDQVATASSAAALSSSPATALSPHPSTESSPAVGPAAAQADPALTPVVGTSPNTSRILRLDGQEAGAFDSGDVSVTNAVRASTENAETTMQLHAVETKLEAIDSDEARSQVLRNATGRMEARIDDLQDRETAARTQYRTGANGADEYLTVLGEVNRRATHLATALDRLDGLAADDPAVRDQIADMQASTYWYTGPISTELGAAVVGEGPTQPVFVAASERGMVVSALRDGTYVRQAIRTDARDEAVGGVNLDAAQDRIATLYPWAWENNAGVSIRSIGQDVFRFQLSHSHGAVDSLLDTSSGHVYREVQTKSVDRLPTQVGYTLTANNTTMVVSDTYAGGPLQVAVQNATGAPLDATVSVNGTEVGVTGDDGSVWTLSPAGTYNVTARTQDEELRVAVTAR